ncbi:hypothetical protein PSTEL_22850 [Paenibacillus stellifer]|uniref:Integron-associated effector binding protein domain-containing protein n=1 Tax=Paenibacillus stellifer TaxID=169760 RepID=A0A089LXA2_9BACL|nr:hypothetical protein [Paenibacillus stellifer]AIQ65532.1 hypothetical protein PSTEL_22850 [Paenibacillus stellifer]
MFRIISLPPFKAVASEVDKEFDFSSTGKLGIFDAFFSTITPKPHESFMPRDFLYYDEQQEGMVWIWALTESGETGGFDTLDFEGGYYLTFDYRDGDDEARDKLYQEALHYIEQSAIFALDIRKNHYSMGHIITPPDIIKAQGWAQMEAFIPVRLFE